jgi:kynurenine formamidase
VVDVSERALADRDYLITKSDLRAWERRNGRISPGSIVLLRTGFGQYWPDAERYLGTAGVVRMRCRCFTSPVWARTVPVGW